MLLVTLKLVVAAPSEQKQPSFTAFDCDKPMEVKVATIPIDCQASAENLELGGLVNISVWQEASEDTLGVLCKVERSEWLSYCGVWSHQSLIAPGTTMRPQEVSTKECRRMHREGMWTDETGKDHKVMGEGVTFLNYVEAGHLNYYNNKISCQGTRVQVKGGESYDRVVKLVDMKIKVQTVTVKRRKEGYEVPEAHLQVRPKDIKEGGVELGHEGTLLVDPLKPGAQTGCSLELLGHLAVLTQKSKSGKGFSRILFNKRHKIYLLQRNQTREGPGCVKTRYWRTNLPGIFVRKEGAKEREGSTKEQKNPAEADLVNHFTELRDFTSAELKMDLEHARLRETCLRYLDSVKGAPVGFQQGHTAGTFTEIKGEVATSIRCSRVSVRARPDEKVCFSDMPVDYLGEPRYVEPISRILKRAAVECQCEQAPPLLSQEGTLLRMGPTLQVLPNVKEMMMTGGLTEDTAAGKGVYPAAALEAAQRLLRGRWREEMERREGSWNLSQPVWHPQDGGPSGSWSLADLFHSHQWLTGIGKAMMVVGGVCLTLQGGSWAAGLLGAWRGARLASPAVDLGTGRKIWEVTKALLCSDYNDGRQRGNRAIHRGDNDLVGVESGRQTFHLASSSGES